MRQPLTRIVRSLRKSQAGARDATDGLALQQLAPLGGGPLPWSIFSMRPAGIAAIVSEALRRRPRLVVECGSGNSTIFLARALRHLGEGRVITFDHDEAWGRVTREIVAREGLDEYATVIDAPLVDGWYDRAAIPPLERIDMLVVDGPPAHTELHARYLALPHFEAALADGAAIFLDDANRAGEQAVLARWERETQIAFRAAPGGLAVAEYRRG